MDAPIDYGIAALFGTATLLLLAALLQLRRARKVPYWRMRRAAGQRGGQLFLAAVVLYGITGLLAAFTGVVTIALDNILGIDATPQTTSVDIPATIEYAVDATLMALTPTPTATLPPTITPKGFVNTDSEGESPSLITILGVSDSAKPKHEIFSTYQAFEAGIESVFIFFEAPDLSDEVPLKVILSHNEMVVYEMILTPSKTPEGMLFTAVHLDEGFLPGIYRVEISLERTSATSIEFAVTNA